MAKGNPNGNPQNLISIGDRPEEEKRAITSAGGKKSQEVRREKRLINEVARAFLDIDMSEKKKREAKQKFGLSDELLTNRFPLIVHLYNIINDQNESAVTRMSAMKMLIEFSGESPAQIAMKEAEKAQKQQIEDDPFSKAIKKMFGGESE